MPLLTIVTSVRNRCHHLRYQIQSLDALRCFDRHIIVDYGSTIPVEDEIDSLSSRCQVIRAEYADSWWLTHACNIGFAYCETPFVLKVDADTVSITEEFLESIVSGLEHSDVLCSRFGLQDWNLDKSLFSSSGVFAARLEALEDICGFNPYIKGWGWDEIDLHSRLFLSGYSIERISLNGFSEINHDDIARVLSVHQSSVEVSRESAAKISQITNRLNSVVAKYCIEKRFDLPRLKEYRYHHELNKMIELQGIDVFTVEQKEEIVDDMIKMIASRELVHALQASTYEKKYNYLRDAGVALTPALLPKIFDDANDSASINYDKNSSFYERPKSNRDEKQKHDAGNSRKSSDYSSLMNLNSIECQSQVGRVVIDIGLPLYRDNSQSCFAQFSAMCQSPEAANVIICDNMPERRGLAAPKAPHVRYLKNEVNIGGAKNFSKCWHLSTSRYFAWLGDDDYLHPNFASTFARAIKESEGRYSAWFSRPAKYVEDGIIQEQLGGTWLSLGDRVDRCRRYLHTRSWNYLFYGVYDKTKVRIETLERFQKDYSGYLQQIDQCWSFSNLVLGPFGWVDSSLYFYNSQNWCNESSLQRERSSYSALVSQRSIREIGDQGIQQLIDVHLIFLMLLYFIYVLEDNEGLLTSDEWASINGCIRMWCLQQIATTSLRGNPRINNDGFVGGIRSGSASLEDLLLWASSILDIHGSGEVEYQSLSKTALASPSLAVRAIYAMTAR